MAEDTKPETTDDLLEAITAEWQRLMQAVAKLEAAGKIETPDAGGWSPKDNLAHLAEWLKILIGYHMDKRPSHEVMGVAPEVTKDWDFDAMNMLLFERNRGRTLRDVKVELQRVYDELTGRLRAMPFSDLMKPRHADRPEDGPLLNWVLSDTSEHFAEHRETIEKLL
jgi:hypothetical protein